MENIKLVLEELVKMKRASWDRSKESCKIFWNTPQEWSVLIYQWAESTGKIGTVCTLFEIINGDDVQDQEFYGLDQEIAKMALNLLEKDKKASLFESLDKSIGVKFH